MPGTIRSLIQDIEDKFENTFHKAHMVAGICNSPNLEQVKDLLEHGEKLAKRAKMTVDFANSAQILGQGGERLGGEAEEDFFDVDALLRRRCKYGCCNGSPWPGWFE